MHCARCPHTKVDLTKGDLVDDMGENKSIPSNEMGNVETEAQYIFVEC